MKKQLTIIASIIYLTIYTAFGVGPYKGNLKYAIGDVKQGQITNKLDTKKKIDHVLAGFKRIGFNAVRINIFAEGKNPNQEMFDYLYKQAKSQGFKIFANPAEFAGAKRIANGILNLPDKSTGPKVKNNPKAAGIVIDRIIKFSKKYHCHWICPFNEDANADAIWSVEQINEIFSSLHNKINGAQLVGPCTWGIGPSVNIFKKTKIHKYVRVATSHNLGFDHEEWKNLKEIAKKYRLPVWDSEVTDHKKFEDKKTRLEVAIEEDLDGIVFYHAWATCVNSNNGKLRKSGEKIKELINK